MNTAAFKQRQDKRYWIDRGTRFIVAAGGASVIGAIAVMFAYLLWVALPLLLPASMSIQPPHQDTEHATADPVVFADFGTDSQTHIQFRRSGQISAWSHEHKRIGRFELEQQITRVIRVYPSTNSYIVVDDNQALNFLRARFEGGSGFDLEQPVSQGQVALFNSATDAIDATVNGNTLMVAASHATQVNLARLDITLPDSPVKQLTFSLDIPVSHLFIGPRQEWLYAISDGGDIRLVRLSAGKDPAQVLAGALVLPGRSMTAVTTLVGRYSLLVADNSGQIYQWTLLPEGEAVSLVTIRSFDVGAQVRALAAEPQRKGFAALTGDGQVHLLHSTSGRILDSINTNINSSDQILFADRANALLGYSSDGQLQVVNIDNPHPEISLQTLWGQVWYEGYTEPVYAWQSSAADTDFEPKFSLTPLAFGTLKAAAYALLVAIPIAVLGAIYTAYFMHPQMRAWVKPGIEVMAALPTVVLGFIGGLWLAPIVERNLSGILGIMLIIPLGLLLFSYLWHRLPGNVPRSLSPWYGLIACPLLVVLTIVSFQSGLWMETNLFGGDSRAWLLENWGLNYEQRNAMIVGIIMGLAVIPAIFSLCEDAVYGVPEQLSQGALALGATRWQTLTSVVLLTASPGIFSALILGAGRAVGETMIVLMVTGNTPIMGFNVFEGMRTFAANIAVELPEAEVASTHFRVLFYSALLLFVFTFLFNSIADLVRRRLRGRYGSL